MSLRCFQDDLCVEQACVGHIVTKLFGENTSPQRCENVFGTNSGVKLRQKTILFYLRSTCHPNPRCTSKRTMAPPRLPREAHARSTTQNARPPTPDTRTHCPTRPSPNAGTRDSVPTHQRRVRFQAGTVTTRFLRADMCQQRGVALDAHSFGAFSRSPEWPQLGCERVAGASGIGGRLFCKCVIMVGISQNTVGG